MPARRYCCVVDCKNSEQNSPQLTFYRFPGRTYQIDQKNRWIQAVRRTSCDGKQPWQPNKNTRICSSHFIGGKKSELMNSPSYIPTIFPPIYQNNSLGSTTALATRHEQLQKRKNGIVNYKIVEMDITPAFINSNLSDVRKPLLQLVKKQEARGVPHDIQKQETSGSTCNIKEEISIDESVLEDYLIPKLEFFKNSPDDVDPLSLSCVEIGTSQETVSRSSPKTTTEVSTNIAESLTNIIPKLEIFENTSEDVVKVENNVVFLRMQNKPVQETTILRSTLKDNTNFSLGGLNTTQSKKIEISDHDFPNMVQVKSENREDYVDYAMYIAARLKNSTQSESAIAIAKEKIELILCDLDKGIFDNLIAPP